MKNILILGTGASAAELTSYIEDNNRVAGSGQRNILGYIDFAENIEKYWKKYHYTKEVIGDIDTFQAEAGTEVLIGISDIPFRNKMIAKLQERKMTIGNFYHHSSIISPHARIGTGNIVYPYCVIGPNSSVGDFNILTSYSFISHDCQVGNGNFFSSAGLAGRVTIGNNNFFGIRSTVIPGVSIGNENTIQAGMTIDKPVEDHATVFYRYKEKLTIISG